jgi:DNA-binding NtrC family response regulator
MKCLMLVDDHARVRAELEGAVPGVAEAVVVETAAEAVEVLRTEDVELFLLDAGRASPQVLSSCRAASDAAIITLGPDEVAGVRTMRNGADDFLEWPAHADSMRPAVEASMAHRRIRRTAARASQKLDLLTMMGA